MTPRIPRVLPVRPVEVPTYVPDGEIGPVPTLVRGEGSVTFDPAVLAESRRAAAHAPELGALQGMVAVPDTLVSTHGASVLVNVGGRTVSLTPLWQPDAQTREHALTVCGVYEPLS